ncbi:MAG: ferrous iron transport protein B [Pirellulales bacterium]|nr:ferrous iron transport protein B [Pirellulales bacterium]
MAISSVASTVALIGNPNTGKSTLFGELVGSPQRVGNYPGVTVEKKIGRTIHDGHSYNVIDLPGLYSLSPHSRDEMVAVDLLLGRYDNTPAVDMVVCVLDACNLDRNLYLLSQILELGLPTIVALNKLDVAEGLGLRLDVEELARRVGVPVVCTQANRGRGTEQLKAVLGQSLGRQAAPPRGLFPKAFEEEVALLEEYFTEQKKTVSLTSRSPHWLVERLLLDTSGYLKDALFPKSENPGLDDLLAAARDRLAEAKCRVPKIETTSRYAWSHTVLEDVLHRPDRYRTTMSDRIDHVLTHRVWGTGIFAVLMLTVFQSVFNGARPIMAMVEYGSGAVGQFIESHMAEGAMRSLLVDGVVGGVGAVVGFLPQILILFMFIAILEDCGYMSRAAFLMDRLMSSVGLSGRSFIPMLSSFACAVPGIMATRVISNDRDRLTTILVAPLMTCSARLPIYTLLIAAFIPAVGEHSFLGGWLNLQGLTLAGLYLLGIITAVMAALVFKKTILRGEPSPFLLELPDYKWPSPSTVLYRVLERCWEFVCCAGTIVLLVSILIWAAAYYPHDRETVEGPYLPRMQAIENELAQPSLDQSQLERLEQEQAALERKIQAAYQHQSILGRLGRMIEPVVEPLGWDWRIGCAVIASFSAREVVVATLGVIYNLGGDLDPGSDKGRSQLTEKLRQAKWDGTQQPVFNIPVALSIMVFYALCAQCVATLAVIKAETGSWRWPVFSFCYMTTLAYIGAFVTYHIGMMIGG